MLPSPLLLAAIAIEGYAVLAVELLAIRQLTPYVGNATDAVEVKVPDPEAFEPLHGVEQVVFAGAEHACG